MAKFMEDPEPTNFPPCHVVHVKGGHPLLQGRTEHGELSFNGATLPRVITSQEELAEVIAELDRTYPDNAGGYVGRTIEQEEPR